MAKSVPWGTEAIPRGESMPKTSVGGYGAFSSGPVIDPTPADASTFHAPISDMMPSTPGGITDAVPIQNSPFGPPYGRPSSVPVMHGDSESAFQRLEGKLAHKKGVTNPAGLAAKIGREELGQAEMTRRSVEGRK
jgi:hypothetical protein